MFVDTCMGGPAEQYNVRSLALLTPHLLADSRLTLTKDNGWGEHCHRTTPFMSDG
jgi:hypothetical protein